MSKKEIGLFAVMFLMLMTGTAMADTAAARIAEAGLEILVPIVVLFATWAAHRLIKVFETKTGIDVPERLEAQIDGWVNMGIAYAEEKARTAVKTAANKISGPEKLEMAAGFVLDLAEQYKLKDLAKEKLMKKIEAKLGVSRYDYFGGLEEEPALPAEEVPPVAPTEPVAPTPGE